MLCTLLAPMSSTDSSETQSGVRRALLDALLLLLLLLAMRIQT
jgi:hypothetical protein